MTPFVLVARRSGPKASTSGAQIAAVKELLHDGGPPGLPCCATQLLLRGAVQLGGPACGVEAGQASGCGNSCWLTRRRSV